MLFRNLVAQRRLSGLVSARARGGGIVVGDRLVVMHERSAVGRDRLVIVGDRLVVVHDRAMAADVRGAVMAMAS